MWDNTLIHARLTFGFTLDTYNFGVSVGHLSQHSECFQRLCRQLPVERTPLLLRCLLWPRNGPLPVLILVATFTYCEHVPLRDSSPFSVPKIARSYWGCSNERSRIFSTPFYASAASVNRHYKPPHSLVMMFLLLLGIW